jgi:hypothetical protein
MNAQEIFDTVARNLITQGRPASKVEEGGEVQCLYRAPGGAKCAFGGLIPDDCYDPNMEDQLASAIILQYACLAQFKPYIGLINALQSAHDDWARTETFEAYLELGDLLDRLAHVAERLELDAKVLSEPRNV